MTGNNPKNNNPQPASNNTTVVYQNAGNSKRHGKRYLASRLTSHPAPFRQQGKENWTGEKPHSEPIYHESINTATENTASTNIINKAASPDLALSTKSNQEENLPGTFKQPDLTTKKPGSAEPAVAPERKNIGCNRWEAGIKAGYELGFMDRAAVKYVVSPYLQYNITPRVAIMTQPAVKYDQVNTRDLNNAQSYYDNYNQVNQSSVTPHYGPLLGGHQDTSYTTTFKYTESHDSIAKSNKFGGSYFEFEVPVLFKYKLTGQLSVYGGVNIIYSKFSGYTENTFTKKGITTTDSVTVPGIQSSAPSEFGYNIKGSLISTYKSPYTLNPNGQFNIGYMAGVSYAYSNRWLADALIQQAPFSNSAQNTISQSTTYFRVSIGYKLTK